ncbi:MAG TPA: MFS transporter, partial [Streptosporangiales bacterium]
PGGRLGDARTRRNVFCVGVAVFTLASAVAGAAQSPAWLIAARLAQGVGGGLTTPQVAGFIQTLFSGPDRGKAFGIFGATIGLATAIGPLLGGVLIAAFGATEGWRYVFYINVPVGVVAIVLAFRLLPVRPSDSRQRLDPVGVGLLAVALFLVLFPVVHGREDRLGSRPWWLEGVAAAVFAGFVVWERRLRRRGGDPMIDLGLFRLRSFSLGSALALSYFAGFTAIFLVLSLYFQNGLGYDALLAGLALTPFAVGSGGSALLGGRIVSRYGRAVVVVGMVLFVVGLGVVDVVVAHVHGRSAGWATAPALFVAGVGSGLVVSPNQALTLAEVSGEGGGSGGGVLQTGQRVGAAYGIAFVSALFFREVATTRGDYATALSVGLRLVLVLVLVALLIGVADLVTGRRRTS